MKILLIMKINFILSFMFMFMKHPLSLGVILLMQTLLVSLNTGVINLNFWFSYILFIVMIGGMLVLFMYMTSIASNEKFKFSSKLMFMFISLSMILLIKYDYMNSYIYMNILETKQQMLNMKYELAMTKYMNYPNNLIMFLMFFYLFITLIMATKITKMTQGPLRQKI